MPLSGVDLKGAPGPTGGLGGTQPLEVTHLPEALPPGDQLFPKRALSQRLVSVVKLVKGRGSVERHLHTSGLTFAEANAESTRSGLQSVPPPPPQAPVPVIVTGVWLENASLHINIFVPRPWTLSPERKETRSFVLILLTGGGGRGPGIFARRELAPCALWSGPSVRETGKR